jgi:anaerobic magnesium-protoporphyrin IX monomethyl ester cyclase
MTYKKKKIALVKAPDGEFFGNLKNNMDADLRTSYSYTKPLISTALALLYSFIEEYGGKYYEVIVKDFQIDELLDSEDEYACPMKIKDRIDSFFDTESYDAIGLSVMFSVNHEWADYISHLSKRKNPKTPIIMGGGYPTTFPEKSLNKSKCDYVVIGEGEDTFLYLLNKIFDIKNTRFDKIFSDISGYLHRDIFGNDVNIPKTTFIDNLDLVPTPNWDVLRGKEYFSKNNDSRLVTSYYFPVLTTRGCPYLCTFCSVYQSDGRKMRCRSIEKIIEEIDFYHKKYNFKTLYFTDDDANVNRKLFNSLLRELIKKNYDIQYEVYYVAINALTEETVRLMSELGMKKILLPIETGSPRMQKIIRKNISLDRAKRAVGWAKKYGFNISVNLMVGFPQETMEDINLTLDLAREIGAHQTQIWIATPWEGTEMYDYAEANNHLPKDGDGEMIRGYRDTEHFINVDFDYEELRQLTYDINIEINFIKHSMFDEPKRYKELYQYYDYLRTGLNHHPILFICLGYLGHLLGDVSKGNKDYLNANELLSKEKISSVYQKYLEIHSEEPVIQHFKQSLQKLQLVEAQSKYL